MPHSTRRLGPVRRLDAQERLARCAAAIEKRARRLDARAQADRLCEVLNVAFSLGAEAEMLDGRYTGRIVLDEQSTARLLQERKQQLGEGRAHA